MKYQIDLNDEDYLRFNIFYATHSKVGQHNVKMARLAFPLVCVLAVVIFMMAGAATTFIIAEGVVLAAASVCWQFYLPKMMEKSVKKNIDRIKTDGKMPYHAHSEIELLDFTIVERSSHGQIHVKYEDIEKVYDTEAYLFIFYSAAEALLIPVRCLGGQKERVVAFLTDKTACVCKG